MKTGEYKQIDVDCASGTLRLSAFAKDRAGDTPSISLQADLDSGYTDFTLEQAKQFLQQLTGLVRELEEDDWRMRRVILESPYAGDIEGNVAYARECVRHSLSLGEAPIASHLLYTQPNVLRDEVPEERQLGIDAGLAWRAVAEKSVFYSDRGWSRGMLYALHGAIRQGHEFEIRAIRGAPQFPACLDEDMDAYVRSKAAISPAQAL